MELQNRLQKTLAETYTIERELGGGGMSRVFVATEQALGRQVVVKVLPLEAAGQLSIERFRREIRLAASLQQANIVPVLAAGDADGVPYYTMPFVRGESLRARLAARGALPIAECVAIFRDVARALAFAHSEGVVHRDIKPENILLSGGTAVVTDFGIAKALAASSALGGAPTLTQAGLMLGTPAYMAPEQVLGDDVDHRADIYALGVVAYEMLTGAAPFSGRSAQAVLAAHAVEAPESIAKRRPDVPPPVAALVMRCLAKEQAGRPESAAVVLEHLETAVAARTASMVPTGAPAQPTIAVLPFANMSGDPDSEFLSDGISEEILNALARLRGLRVIARTSSFAFKGKQVDMREIGARLGAGVILDGSVRRSGSRLRIAAQLIDAGNGVQLWSDSYDREMRDVFDIQDDITTAITAALKMQLLPTSGEAQARPIDPDTYESFLRGRFHINRPPEGIRKGVNLLQQVAERAPAYQPALLELARSHTVLAIFGMEDSRVAWSQVRDIAQQLLALNPNEGRAHAEIGNVACFFDYDFTSARRHYERALALAPDDAWIRGFCSHFYPVIGEHDLAKQCSRHAVLLDPLNPLPRFFDVWTYYFDRQWSEVIARSQALAELDPHYSEAYRLRALALLNLGRPHEALESAERAVELSNRHPYQLSILAIVLAAAGDRARARGVHQEIFERAERESISEIALATPYLALGDHDAFFATMERYYGKRGHWMVMLRAEPLFDSVRADPRFMDLVRRVGIPEWNREAPHPALGTVVPAEPFRKPTIAVLPLTNLSASADDEYFSDGITEDIIAQLSQIPNLRVISRTSVMRYKKATKGLRDIATELGATHLVEGSVRRAGQKLRIVTQLIDGRTDENVWAQSFDRDMSDVFAVQSEVAERITDALRTRLEGIVRKRIARRPTDDQQAYDLFLLARHHLNSSTADGFARAMELCEKAVERDPNFGRAWAALGRAHHFHLAGYYGVRPRDAMVKVIQCATRALELDPDIAEGHMMLGYVDEFIHHDLAAQQARKQRAVALSPNNADARLALGNTLVVAGRYDEALDEANVALELDPASELVHLHANWLRYLTRHCDEALSGLEAAEAQFGQKLLPLVHGQVLVALGRYEEGADVLRQLCEHTPITLNLGVFALCLAAAGRDREARALLRDLHARDASEYVWPVPLGPAYAYLGETELAFRYLTQSYEDRTSWIHMPYSPTFDPFRGDPRFHELARRTGAVAPPPLA